MKISNHQLLNILLFFITAMLMISAFANLRENRIDKENIENIYKMRQDMLNKHIELIGIMEKQINIETEYMEKQIKERKELAIILKNAVGGKTEK